MRITRTRLLCEMQANSFWAEFLRIIFKFRKERKISRRLFTSFIKREFRHFPLVVAVTVKKWTNKRGARAELLFCLFNQLLFWRSCCRRRRGILKSLLSRVQHNNKFPCSTREFTTPGCALKSTKVLFIWKKHVPGRRITRFSELPWASQLLLHYLTDNWRPFTRVSKSKWLS